MENAVREVTLPEVLEAREARVWRQQALISQYEAPLVCFTMNIPGPVKDSPLIRRAFREGCRALEAALAQKGLPVPYTERQEEFTGCQAFYAVDGALLEVKGVCAALEDSHPMGRLFDMDVLDAQGRKVDRDRVAGGERCCLVCGAPGRGCASRRVHSVAELQGAVRKIMEDFFRRADGQALAALAGQALEDELHATPKPGLVDRANSGSHRDMDLDTFQRSREALLPYLLEFVTIGQEGREAAPKEVFRRLRQAGLRAEAAMFRATGGVNTHKGAIFTMSVLCAAAGRLWRPEGPCRDEARVLAECAVLSRETVAEDFAAMEKSGAPETVGQRLYLNHGFRGIRGEVAGGLRSVREVSLPALQGALEAGRSWNDACVIALLHLVARVQDTNMVSRGGLEGAETAAREVRALLAADPLPDMETAARLDRAFIRRNLSPGGCADLLAATCFVYRLGWRIAEKADGCASAIANGAAAPAASL